MLAFVDTVLLERECEMARLREVVDATAHGAGAVVLVEGEAGIGKSALLERALGLCEPAGITVLTASGVALERAFGYGAARQLLEHHVAKLTPPRRRALLRGAAPAASVLGLAEDAAADSEDDGAELVARHALFRVVRSLVDRNGPLALIVDDLQWVDGASARWLAYLARRLGEAPVLIVGALRTGERPVDVEAIAALRTEAGELVLQPQPLSSAAVETLMHSSLNGGEVEFAAACHRVTAGNPLLVSELLSAARREAIAPTAASAGRVHRLGSSGLADRVLGRLEGLSAEARAVAEAVAVLESAELRLAAELSGLKRAAAEAAADELVEAALLGRERPLRYVHSLLGAAVLEALGPARRGALHRRAAELLDPVDEDRAAAHLLFSEPAEELWTVGRLRAAAGRELERGAPDAAVELLERALAEPAGDARVDVLAELGRAEALLGRHADAAAHLGEAARTSRPEQRLALVCDEAIACAMDNRAEEAAVALQGALEEPSTEGRERHRLEVVLAMVSTAHPSLTGPGFERLERVAATTRPDEDVARLLLAMAAYADYWRARAPAAEVAERIERLLRGGDSHEAELYTGLGSVWCAITVFHADRVDAALRLIEGMEASGKRHASVPLIAAATTARSRIMRALGRLEEAELAARRALDLDPESVHRFGYPAVIGGLVEVLVESGRPGEAEAVMAEHSPGLVLPAGTWHAARIALLCAQHRHDEAAVVAEELLERLAQRHHAGIRLREHAAQAFLDAGDRERAAAVAAEGIAVGRRWGAPSALAPHLRIRGLALGEEEALREAAALVEDGPFRIEAARCLLALGAHLRRTRRRAEARDPLRRALHLAQRSGAQPLAERALAELRASGARPRSALLSGVESLTPSELRVAKLVAGGASNPEVARSLYVSRSTVETHLRAVFRKLDVSDRSQLAAALDGAPQKITEAQ